MNGYLVLVYFVCFALIAGAAFALMWGNMKSINELMDKPKTKRPYEKVRMVPEDSKMKDHAFYYYAMKPTKGEKKNQKLRLRKFDPVTQKHIWWVEKKLPPHSK